MKTIKIMSDGNQAKVGMICAYIENIEPPRIEIGVITHIKTGSYDNDHIYTPVFSTDTLFRPINATTHWPYLTHHASLYMLSKATPEQKKLYWLELEKQNSLQK